MAEIDKQTPQAFDQTAFKRKPKVYRTVIVVTCIVVALFTVRFVWEKFFKIVYPKEYGFSYPALDEDTFNSNTFLELASAAAREQEYDKAFAFVQYGIQNFPDEPKLLVALADLYSASGEKEKAASTLAKAAALAKDDPLLYVQSAELYLSLGEKQLAFQQIDRAYRLDNTNPLVVKRYLQIANLNNHYALSEPLYYELLKQEPQNQKLLFAYNKVRAWAKEHPPKDHSTILLQQAAEFLEKGNTYMGEETLEHYVILFGLTDALQLNLAQSTYRALLGQKVDQSEVYYQLAHLYFRYDFPEKAFEAATKALELQDKNLDYLKLYVSIATQLDAYEEKEAAYQKIVALVPEDKRIREELALFSLSREKNITPKQIRSHPLLLQAVIENYQGNTTTAFETLEKYSEEEGTNPIYTGLLSYFATTITECQIQAICSNEKLYELAKKLSLVGKDTTYEARVLQTKAKELSQTLTCRSPRCVSFWELYAQIARLHEHVPDTDYVDAARAYTQILQLDPCNEEAKRNLPLAVSKDGEIDTASYLYNQYVCRNGSDKEAILEYADVLELQGRMPQAFYLLLRYRDQFCCDTQYLEKLAHISNSAYRPTIGKGAALMLLNEDPNNYNAWLSYTYASSQLNQPQETLHGLSVMNSLNPGAPETLDMAWLVLPNLMSFAYGHGTFYQDSVGLTRWKEGFEFAPSICPGVRLLVGADMLQTDASQTFSVVLGLGNLRQLNGERWASEAMGWLGIDMIVNPHFLFTFRGGWDETNIENANGTLAYKLKCAFPFCDNFEFDYTSSYQFLLTSPRALSRKVKQWKHGFFFDWEATPNTEFLLNAESLNNSDGNRGFDIKFQPRHSYLHLEHWKFSAGFMGQWYGYEDQLESAGYYSPNLYQGYALELFLDYKINYFNEIHLNGFVGTQKDTFSTHFNFLGNGKLELLFTPTINWYLTFIAEYHYVETTNGYFSLMQYSGQVYYRF